MRGADASTAAGLAGLPGVMSATAVTVDGDAATFVLQAREGSLDAVQRAVTRFAVETDLTLVENAPDRLELEDVFLRLINAQERAA